MTSTLNTKQTRDILKLKKKEDFFDGTLGTWNTAPVDLELKDDVNPVCSRPYPLLKVHKEMFRKEVDILVLLGVIRETNDSQLGATSFAQLKTKTDHIRFLSSFWNLNRKLKRKPYPMPKIREIILNLEGFQYTTSLGLNTGYFQICLSKESKHLCTIILAWGNKTINSYEWECVTPRTFSRKKE